MISIGVSDNILTLLLRPRIARRSSGFSMCQACREKKGEQTGARCRKYRYSLLVVWRRASNAGGMRRAGEGDRRRGRERGAGEGGQRHRGGVLITTIPFLYTHNGFKLLISSFCCN